MSVKSTLVVAIFGGACLVTGASAFPIASMPSETTTIQFHDDEGGDMARRILRGVESGGHRDRNHERGFDGRSGYRDHQRGFDGRDGFRDRDHQRGFDDRGGYRDRDHQRRRGGED
jgi:hypothetical protein